MGGCEGVGLGVGVSVSVSIEVWEWMSLHGCDSTTPSSHKHHCRFFPVFACRCSGHMPHKPSPIPLHSLLRFPPLRCGNGYDCVGVIARGVLVGQP